MSVLTVSGSGIPDNTLRDYSQTGSARAAINTLPPSSQTTYSYTRPDRKSYAARQLPPLPQTFHQHSRTNSSQAVPSPLPQPARSGYPPISHSRQSSTGSTNMSMQRQPTAASASSGVPRRSTSGRSTATTSPTSYVALMRKQKATVWCDRAQNIDPRIAAAQKAAKHRAHLEVSSNANSAASGRTSTISSGGLPSKIRHGGVPKAPAYVPANLSGAGVPMRLSANEMLGDEEEDTSFVRGDNAMVHGRSGSGKSSTNSAQYRSGYPRPEVGRFSSASTPPSGNDGGSPSSRDRIPEEETHGNTEYFVSREKSDSEDSFGELKDLAGPSSKEQALSNAKKAEDLRRRGSVDERAMSMGTGVKLFVANPDLDDD